MGADRSWGGGEGRELSGIWFVLLMVLWFLNEKVNFKPRIGSEGPDPGVQWAGVMGV